MGQFKRVKGYSQNPSVLSCQRKNKRHIKFCDEYLEKKEREAAVEVAAIFGEVIARVENVRSRDGSSGRS